MLSSRFLRREYCVNTRMRTEQRTRLLSTREINDHCWPTFSLNMQNSISQTFSLFCATFLPTYFQVKPAQDRLSQLSCFILVFSVDLSTAFMRADFHDMRVHAHTTSTPARPTCMHVRTPASCPSEGNSGLVGVFAKRHPSALQSLRDGTGSLLLLLLSLPLSQSQLELECLVSRNPVNTLSLPLNYYPIPSLNYPLLLYPHSLHVHCQGESY